MHRRILVGRLFSRAGDHAWDFAVPMAILKIFPQHLFLPILYYFAARIGSVFLMPVIGAGLDHRSTRKSLVVASGVQVLGVGVGALILIAMSFQVVDQAAFTWSLTTFFLSVILILAGVVAALGAGILDIIVLNIVVPTLFDGSRLTAMNSKISQVDLAMEVTAPLVAGFLLMWNFEGLRLAGFALIAAANILSFLPEIFLLLPRIPKHTLRNKVPEITSTAQNIFSSIIYGWRNFFKEPVAPSVLAYSFLWLSILSPHGVLLTTYLKGVWGLQESTLGVFRGMGAILGFAGTLVFPWFVKRMGLFKASSRFIGWQALMVFAALIAFFYVTLGQAVGIASLGFMVFILLSRAGLYGFCLGELEIRQTMVAPEKRGRVNGFTSSWLNAMTLLVYGLGSVLATPKGFGVMVVVSACAVVVGAVVFHRWQTRSNRPSQ